MGLQARGHLRPEPAAGAAAVVVAAAAGLAFSAGAAFGRGPSTTVRKPGSMSYQPMSTPLSNSTRARQFILTVRTRPVSEAKRFSSGDVVETTTHLSVSSVFNRSARSISDTASFLSVSFLSASGSATAHFTLPNQPGKTVTAFGTRNSCCSRILYSAKTRAVFQAANGSGRVLSHCLEPGASPAAKNHRSRVHPAPQPATTKSSFTDFLR